MAHPSISRRVAITRRELRTRHGVFKVLPAEAGHVYGLGPSLVLVDELAWHRGHDLYVALRSSIHKRHARLITISTRAAAPRARCTSCESAPWPCRRSSATAR